MQSLPSDRQPARSSGLTLAPFRAVRYNPDRISGLADVTSPPYDVIGPGIVERLLAAEPWLAKAPELVQEVLLNMAFNLGVEGLLGFRQTLALLAARDYAGAAQSMLASRWAGQVGQRAARLAAQVRGSGA